MRTVFLLRRRPEPEALVQRRRRLGRSAKAENLERRSRELYDAPRERRTDPPAPIFRQDVEVPEASDSRFSQIRVLREPADRHETAIDEAAEKRLTLSRKPVRTRLPLVCDAPHEAEA